MELHLPLSSKHFPWSSKHLCHVHVSLHWVVHARSLDCARQLIGVCTQGVNQPAVRSRSREEQEPGGAGAVRSRSRCWCDRAHGVGLPSPRIIELQVFMPCTCRQSHFIRQLIGVCRSMHDLLIASSAFACQATHSHVVACTRSPQVEGGGPSMS